ncbi:hypothetical protein V8G54_025591 [Vigna mungo]|uniref:folate gamma-glutamyl hydrolase n=1 Tax=Vigna mungo TaxID=3915 RepID=A0AAQ3RMD9_VIGMU
MSTHAVWLLFLVAFSVCPLPSAGTRSSILLPSRLGLGSPSSCRAPDPNLYYQPVIGIVSHPGDGASGRLSNATDVSYIAASYVKFVEAAGARVVPLIYTEPPEKLLKKLELVNGVLFTGGWAKSGLYFETVTKIFKKILEKNDAGDHFPLYAVCLGFELITMIISQDNNILEEFSASDQASTIQFVESAKIEETVFQRFPPELLRKMTTDCLVMQNHHKNAFEWGSPRIPHTEDAIQITQHAANFLVRLNEFSRVVARAVKKPNEAIFAYYLYCEARKSLNRPVTQELLDNLIYNYSPTYGGKAGQTCRVLLSTQPCCQIVLELGT